MICDKCAKNFIFAFTYEIPRSGTWTTIIRTDGGRLVDRVSYKAKRCGGEIRIPACALSLIPNNISGEEKQQNFWRPQHSRPWPNVPIVKLPWDPQNTYSINFTKMGFVWAGSNVNVVTAKLRTYRLAGHKISRNAKMSMKDSAIRFHFEKKDYEPFCLGMKFINMYEIAQSLSKDRRMRRVVGPARTSPLTWSQAPARLCHGKLGFEKRAKSKGSFT